VARMVLGARWVGIISGVPQSAGGSSMAAVQITVSGPGPGWTRMEEGGQ
jgi:hypothetical protein